MDIYGAEVQVNKLLNYVKGLSDSKPRMYQKSKDRLKELANTCNEVVAVIAEILQDEALLNDGPDEFGGSDSTDVDDVLNRMQDQITELRHFLNVPVTSVPYVDTTDTDLSSARKKALYDYKHCLSMLAHSDMIVQESEDCSHMIWKWFDCRFLENRDSFKYNMKKLPDWIRDIVILYGYHFESGSLVNFKFRFDSWIASISTNVNYAVPYEVFQLDKSLDASKMTLTSVVIWDILLDYGLRELCHDSSSGLYLSEDCVYSLVGSLNSDIMDPYRHYTYDKSILERCNLTLKVGDDE